MLFYAALALRALIARETLDIAYLAVAAMRISLGVIALVVIFYPPSVKRWLERLTKLMGDAFEASYAKTSAKEKSD